MASKSDVRALRAALWAQRQQAMRRAPADGLAARLQTAFYCRGFPALKYKGQTTFTSDIQNQTGTQGRLRWITIGGADEGDQKHAGGTPVLIDGQGNVKAGPKSLEGKPVDDLGGKRAAAKRPAEMPPEAPKRENDTIGDRNAAAAQYLEKLPPALRRTVANLHGSRENRKTGQITTDLIDPRVAREMHADVKKRIGRPDGFGHAVELEGGGVGYASPAGALMILPPEVKGQPWHVSYTSDVAPLEKIAKEADERRQANKPKPKPKPPKQHGDTFDPDEFGESGGEQETPRRKLPGGRLGEAIRSTAEDWGVDPADLSDAVDFVYDERKRITDEREAAKAAARKKTGLTAGDISRLANAGYDYAGAMKAGGVTGQKLRHFDEYAQELAREQPELGLGDPDDPRANFSEGLWKLLAEGKTPAPPKDDSAVLREAANLVLASNHSPQFSPVESEYAESWRRRSTVERYRRWRTRERLTYALNQAFARRF